MSERPPTRWCHAAVRLEDFAIVTWAASPDRLRALLPCGFEPELINGTALVSMVAFRNRGFHFRAAPFARLSCGQVDYRAYVRRGDKTGVWFRLVAIPRWLWSMHWHRTPVRLSARWHGDMCESWSLAAEGPWGGAKVELSDATMPGLDARDDTSSALADPFVGWYRRRDGEVGQFSVWHEPLRLRAASTNRVTCRAFERLALIEPGQTPISAGLQQRVPFDIHTPPSRVALRDPGC